MSSHAQPVRARLPAAVLLLALLTGPVACGRPDSAAVAPPPAEPQVVAQRFAVLRDHPLREAPASVLGKNETRLAAEVAARIEAIAVDVGDEVAAGQLLLRLDARDAALALERAEAALAQADARLAQARAQQQRAEALRARNFVSAEALTLRETELAAAVADRRAAAANVATARRAVEKCTLRAPFRAVVRARSAQVGELTAPGTPLLTLADLGDLQLVAQVQARDAEGLARAATVEFLAGEARHVLRPLRISPAISREARTVEARYAFVERPPAPGSEGRLAWREPRPHLAAELVVRRGSDYGVFLIEDGVARFRPLPAAQEGRPVAVELPDDALIAVQGRHALQDGMRVRLAAPPAAQR